MAAATKQRQHPKLGNQETVRTPGEAGVKEVGTGATTRGAERQRCTRLLRGNVSEQESEVAVLGLFL